MQVDDAHISVRFKYGVHTIFLFVDALAPFSAITEELLGLLRERYPDGLMKSTTSSEKTPVPGADAAQRIVYGVLSVPDDPSQGWKKLKLGARDSFTPSRCGVKDNSIVAFTFVSADGEEAVLEDEDVQFEVEFPVEQEDYFDEEE
ncbi:hypothetical protein ESCO_003330 [Escovopsis weberi]|uniref:Uncharacterized protein n=1 Tax=Escovopsis weberi TaxID=150374 RepID=A0A0M8N228_ESCWE|nr:hypothetical protein ESCO_003330 [Escovopsis weberi]